MPVTPLVHLVLCQEEIFETNSKMFPSLGSTHCAAWSGAAPISRSSNRFNLGAPQLVPPSYISLLNVETGLLRDRLNVLWSFADLVGKNWKLLSLNSLVSQQILSW